SVALCALLAGCGAASPPKAPPTEAPPTNAAITPLQVSLLKVGKADAIILQSGPEIWVIDTGEEEDGEEVVTFLRNQGLDHVDVLVITHYDRDHVGGADTVVEELDVRQVLLPAYEGSSSEYADFMAALDEKGIVPQKLTEPMELSLGEATVLVEPPSSYARPGEGVEIDNNFSLITTVTHGENRLIFAGDAEKQRLRQWLSAGTAAPCDFLKMPHHGVYNTALSDLLEATTPEFAVICSSKKHPADTETLELLKQEAVQSWETKDGNVTVISDGKKLEIHQEREH
ncbi:MAG: MBL fold metallo-hydrolase, partial [Oscillibacter sp.]